MEVINNELVNESSMEIGGLGACALVCIPVCGAVGGSALILGMVGSQI